MPGILELDPFREIRITTLSALRGANFWSRYPMIRMDVNIGAYDDISSTQYRREGIDQLLAALPGLATHRCSVGTPGGFVQRLRTGTYAAHITEHVAIELQNMLGHDIGFGQTRGTGTVGEYTIVFEYFHQAVGLRTAALALEIVQRALAEKLYTVQPAITELTALATTRDVPPLRQHVLCGITGSVGREDTRTALVQLGVGSPDEMGDETNLGPPPAAIASPQTGSSDHIGSTPANPRAGNGTLDALPGNALVITLAPIYILQAGLPYSHSDIAVILDTTLNDVPDRYRDSERAAQLLSVVADAVPPRGVVVCPADAHYLHDFIRDTDREVIKFASSDNPAERARRAAAHVAEYLNHPRLSHA